ncbi:MAG TPA: chalcone isomerase family protein [Thermoanaerobaculia bacterium]
MRSLRTALVLLLLGVATTPVALAAVEVAGVQVPETVTAEGKTLKLNGAGLRKKLLFKVYVAALYVETPSKDGAAVVASSEVKRMRLSILRSLKGSQVSEAISEGFERNSKDQMPRLRDRLKKLEAMIPDVKEGDEIVFDAVPDKGVHVSVRGTDRGTIEGRDFADALFSVWLGPNPVDEELKKALLGG